MYYANDNTFRLVLDTERSAFRFRVFSKHGRLDAPELINDRHTIRRTMFRNDKKNVNTRLSKFANGALFDIFVKRKKLESTKPSLAKNRFPNSVVYRPRSNLQSQYGYINIRDSSDIRVSPNLLLVVVIVVNRQRVAGAADIRPGVWQTIFATLVVYCD